MIPDKESMCRAFQRDQLRENPDTDPGYILAVCRMIRDGEVIYDPETGELTLLSA